MNKVHFTSSLLTANSLKAVTLLQHYNGVNVHKILRHFSHCFSVSMIGTKVTMQMVGSVCFSLLSALIIFLFDKNVESK